jgi:RNA polymerase primary sigma factor
MKKSIASPLAPASAVRRHTLPGKVSSPRRPTSATQPDPAPIAQGRMQNLSIYDLYMREVSESSLLSPAEEVELAGKIQQGDEEARNTMIKANLRLVVKIAREYDGFGLPLLDLINEGNIGLIKAVERFDPNKGGKLSTYSAWWIKHFIRRALANQSRTIRLPVNAVDQIYHISKAVSAFQNEWEREPSVDELSELLHLNPERIEELRQANTHVRSLDMQLGDEDSHTLSDVIQDENAADPSMELEEKSSIDRMQRLMSRLDEREMSILEHRFGLNGRKEKTLEEIGQLFGVTRERIRQLQNEALHKLRALLDDNEQIQVVA